MVCAHLRPTDQLAAAARAALRLPNVGERANEGANRLAERSLDAFDRIEDPTAAGAVTGRRLHPPEAGS